MSYRSPNSGTSPGGWSGASLPTEKRDLIAAVATAAGRAAIGVVRLSGPCLTSILPALVGRTVLPPRKATLCDFRDAQGRAIDAGLAVYFPAPHSYTGEDVLELHGHGGPAVVDQLLRSCLEAGARLADPGEFTFRAFLNHRLDLAQAEAVADLIDAATARAARSAARSLKGEFSAEVNKLIDQLIDLRVRVEACLDFPEEDVEPFLAAPLADALDHLARQLSIIKAAAGRGAILREGATVVMSGPPNVGKSSLMNRLAGWDLAIVTDIPGTTR